MISNGEEFPESSDGDWGLCEILIVSRFKEINYQYQKINIKKKITFIINKVLITRIIHKLVIYTVYFIIFSCTTWRAAPFAHKISSDLNSLKLVNAGFKKSFNLQLNIIFDTQYIKNLYVCVCVRARAQQGKK